MTPAPELAMLWESVDPAAALTERFGFADTTRAVDWLTDTLWAAWALPVESCDRLVISDKNLLAWISTNGKPTIAKCSVDQRLFPRLADTTALTAWLESRDLPVAAPIRSADGRLRVEVDDVSLGVFPVVDGDLLDVDVPEQVAQAGRMLATLHEALASYPQSVAGCRPVGPGQLVHNDFRSANILHNGSHVTAVLDFEEVAYRSRVADLAKATVLLATRYHDWGPTAPPVRETFVAAYAERLPLTSAERDELTHGIATTLDHLGWR